jgi:hypothetical protein
MWSMQLFMDFFLNELEKNNIRRIVFSTSEARSYFICEAKKRDFFCYEFGDSRSVAYIAAGMSEEADETVVIVSNGDGESRSFAPGLTEAFYKELSIIEVTLSNRVLLNWKKEFKDTVWESYSISTCNSIKEVMEIIENIINGKKPCHIDFNLQNDCLYYEKELICMKPEIKIEVPQLMNYLSAHLNNDCILYIEHSIQSAKYSFNCEVRKNNIVSGEYGILSIVLGASLAGKKYRYIGVATEAECVHELNVFGNKCMNNKIVYFVICEKYKKTIIDFAYTMNFKCIEFNNTNMIDEHSENPLLITFDNK